MNKERSNLSVQYWKGIGKVDFRPSQFSLAALREISRVQINSTDSPRIELQHEGGRTTTVGQDDFEKARQLRGKELKSFTTNLAHQMDRAKKVSIIREAEATPYHLSLDNDPYSRFVENLDSLDEI